MGDFQVEAKSHGEAKAIVKFLMNNGYTCPYVEEMDKNFYPAIIVQNNVIGGNDSVRDSHEKILSIHELFFMVLGVIKHPKVKIGCQKINFDDEGKYIFVYEDEEEISMPFEDVETVYNHMVKLRKS